jgi:two-component system cell cycle sensor histidine kinase/response regulator CckA
MEAIGRLAGGVAHDFNNLLTVINGYADMLISDSNLPTGIQEQVREILDASRRAQSLTDQLLTYSRKQVRASQFVDLNAQVVQMQSMLRRLIGEHIALVTELAPDLGRVRADPGQLQQVIMNLAVNARDSMGDGGTLTISTSHLAASAAVSGRRGLGAGEWVVLSVTDTGRGMEKEILSHIFEPFFTTKEKGKGTGLGLSTVYGIVTQAGGHVFVQSSPGQGASFEILLPRAAADPAPAVPASAAPSSAAWAAPSSAPAAAPAARPLSVLLVEDEVLVRDLARSILTRAGYSVQEAANGLEALSTFAASDRPIDLLVTDVIMPGMGGVELARRLTAGHPGLRVVFVSGYAGEALGTQGELAEGIHLVRKPFSPAELLAMIERVREVPG